jgi:release factor glutamine methyltransferase
MNMDKSQNLHSALKEACLRLKTLSIENPEREARILLAHALQKSQEELFMMAYDSLISQEEIRMFEAFITRREKFEPISHIINKRYFWKAEFLVNKFVLDPRPDSELLVEESVKFLHSLGKDKPMILDIGTGSGCLALSILQDFPKASAIATDISFEAIKVAFKNAENLGLRDKINFINCDLVDAINYKFDLIISNPPYISEEEYRELDPEVKHYEPRTALVAQEEGLAIYKRLAPKIRPLLQDSTKEVLQILTSNISDIMVCEIYKDLANHDRIIKIEVSGE